MKRTSLFAGMLLLSAGSCAGRVPERCARFGDCRGDSAGRPGDAGRRRTARSDDGPVCPRDGGTGGRFAQVVHLDRHLARLPGLRETQGRVENVASPVGLRPAGRRERVVGTLAACTAVTMPRRAGAGRPAHLHLPDDPDSAATQSPVRRSGDGGHAADRLRWRSEQLARDMSAAIRRYVEKVSQSVPAQPDSITGNRQAAVDGQTVADEAPPFSTTSADADELPPGAYVPHDPVVIPPASASTFPPDSDPSLLESTRRRARVALDAQRAADRLDRSANLAGLSPRCKTTTAAG